MPSATCLYCSEMKPTSAFNREHVIPEAFGVFDDNFVLRETVCAACNTFFGETLDRSLARDTKEGLDRFAHDVARPKKGRKVGKGIAVKVRGGRFDGALHEWDLDASGLNLQVKPSPQAGFAATEEGPFEWFPLSEVPTQAALAERGFLYCVLGGVSEDEARKFLSERGMSVSGPPVIESAVDSNGEVEAEISGRVGPTIQRGIAKIAMNYLAYHYPEISLLPHFDTLRKWVRFDAPPSQRLVHMVTKRILGGLPDDKQIIAHVVAVRWAPELGYVLGQVSLFGWAQYRVMLSDAPFVLPPSCVESGHAFNTYARQIVPVSRDRRRAARVPLITRTEYLARRNGR